MQTIRRMILTAALGVGLVVASGALAGVVFEVETTYHSGSEGRAETAQMSVEGGNLKMEILPGSGSAHGAAKDEAIFRGDRREMVVVDHESRTYMVVDEAMAEEIGGQVQAAMKEVEKALEGLDPKQREMMEQMLKGQMGAAGVKVANRPKDVYRKTGERATHQGYPCVRYDVLRDGEKVQELWVTDWSRVTGGEEVADAFVGMASFVSEILDAFSNEMGGLPIFGSGPNPVESYAEIGGFPVVSRSFEGGELESETTLRSATERDLDPDAFEPPAGYRRRSMGPQ